MRPPSNSNIKSVYDVLEMVRERTAMYTGSSSLESIQLFLGAYSMGVEVCGFKLECHDEFSQFHDFVSRKLGYTSSTAGWAKMILGSVAYPDISQVDWDMLHLIATEEHHQTAKQLFFTLLREFKDNRE